MKHRFHLPLLCDGVILLRALEPGDVEITLKWENDSRLWHLGNTKAPFSRKQIEEYIATYDGDIFSAGQLRLIVESVESGRALGAVDLYDFDAINRRSAVGILVDERFRRKGIATRTLNLLAEYAYRRLGLRQLWALCAAYNIESVGLFERAGYRRTATLESWIRDGNEWDDAVVMQKVFVN